MSTPYDIYNLVYFPNKTVFPNLVGNFTYNIKEGSRLVLLKNRIIWDSNFTEIPQSICSEDCGPGYWKSYRTGQSMCCFDCFQCPEGKYSVRNNSEVCLLCPKNKWSNAERTDCIPKVITFLSYQEPLGIVLALGAIVFALITVIIFGVFLKYRDTPIVKANNRTLSFILLSALAISFLGSLLYIGHPGKWTCFFRQSFFGMTFSISMSSILAKTFTVIVAFNATRKGENIRKFIGCKTPSLIVCFGSAIQFLICLLWFIFSPPWPHYHNTDSIEMILHCHEGSIFFYLVLGYLCILAGISFIVAFLARSLPDTFNEAKHITFSTFIFFSVWTSFMPCYLSSEGKAVEALEIFAILVSSAGLLLCIFFPKVKIIILKPHKRCNLQIQTIVLENYSS
ncbi:vomeronasal type-2 receptor 26-like [Dendropsophus ebraccatus]|uniref:vomeronasal type-2 receptor 26-like n=1 Tax=Dendropsophus ebraccatus TaxID=150705 RepID=UPI003831E35B